MQPLLRFTLDLFGNSPVVQPPAPTVQFSHKEANRRIALSGAVVAYRFVRARRRTIGFVVGPDGLTVRAPRWTPVAEMEAALQEKKSWILRKLQEAQARSEHQSALRTVWADGMELPFLGAPLRVRVVSSPVSAGLRVRLAAPADPGVPAELAVALPEGATPEQLRDAVQAWFKEQAYAHLRQRLDHFAPLLQVRWRSLRLSNAATRWGSARADGAIALHWRLLHFPHVVIDYVVAHELSHLRVMNHSPAFWATVATVVPDYAKLRRQLRVDALPAW
ncbi:M48 family metallopeptidase [Rhodoferax sp.]|jgi:predicted metal-dependent hydrolase|uniref:M48 family metallopeptidase n=1 Tax=Rhodoferax sp. TaxID=50421 RepID=UPI0037831BEB